MQVSLVVRSVRAAVFALLCVLLATGGHALATGTAPPVWVQVAAVVPVFATGCPLAGRERSLAGIGGALLAVQGGLHLVFDTVQPHQAMIMHGRRMTQAHALTPHATVAHVGAAVMLAWWLRRGEAAVWSLLRRAVAFMPGLAAWWLVAAGVRSTPEAPGCVRPVSGEPGPLRGARLRYAVQRRGPPTGMTYAT